MGGEGSGLIADGAGPLYLRLAEQVRLDLVDDRASIGDRLPSERELIERYSVSRMTVRAALQELQGRRLVSSQPGRGWVVANGVLESTPSLPHNEVRGFTDSARLKGLTSHSRVLEKGVRPATTKEADMLRVAPGASLFEMRRVRYLQDLPIAIEHNLVPLHLAPKMAQTDFNVHSLYAVLRTASPPQHPRYGDYTVEARNPDTAELELLEIEGQVPVLHVTQLSFNQAAEPIEYTTQAYRGDRYTFHAAIVD